MQFINFLLVLLVHHLPLWIPFRRPRHRPRCCHQPFLDPLLHRTYLIRALHAWPDGVQQPVLLLLAGYRGLGLHKQRQAGSAAIGYQRCTDEWMRLDHAFHALRQEGVARRRDDEVFGPPTVEPCVAFFWVLREEILDSPFRQVRVDFKDPLKRIAILPSDYYYLIQILTHRPHLVREQGVEMVDP